MWCPAKIGRCGMDGLWVGLDLGERQTSICVSDGVGRVLHEQACASEAAAIEEVLKPFRDNLRWIAMESGVGVHIARNLRERGLPVAVLNAVKLHRFLTVRPIKTDTHDARGIADAIRLGHGVVSTVHVKSPQAQLIRTRLLLRQRLTQQRIAIEALTQSVLCLHGGNRVSLRAPTRLGSALEGEVTKILKEQGVEVSAEIAALFEIGELMRRHVRQLDAELVRMARSNEVCQIMMTVPGVGPIVALSFFAAIDDPHRFSRIAEVGAYFGLAPVLRQSGAYSSTEGISKRGCKRTRKLLVTAAMVHLRANSPESALKIWGKAAELRIGKQKARVAVARKLAVVLLSMWRSGEIFSMDHCSGYPHRAPSRERAPDAEGQTAT